eukprot:536164-Pelagomonas_calceolata.AAC.1
MVVRELVLLGLLLRSGSAGIEGHDELLQRWQACKETNITDAAQLDACNQRHRLPYSVPSAYSAYEATQ